MHKSQLKIKCYFPKLSHKTKNKREFVNLIINMMRQDGNVKCAGYFKEDDLQKDLIYHLGDGNAAEYKPLLSNEKHSIEKTIHSTIEKCHKVLPHPDLPVFVFVYPWFPNKENRILFRGTTAFATYYTMHLFVDPSFYTKVSIKQTIAHEWNHLVFYRYHDEQKCSLLDHMVMEGLADIFRKEIVSGGVSPWSLALNEKKSLKQLRLLLELLNSTSMDLYRDVFWGNSKFKRWTGYSIGYNIAKKFRDKYPKLTWNKIITKKSKDILNEVMKKEK